MRKLFWLIILFILPLSLQAESWSLPYFNGRLEKVHSVENIISYGFDCLDENNIVVTFTEGGRKSTVLLSSDAGTTWNQIYADSTVPHFENKFIYGIAYPSVNLIMAVCDSGKIIRSENKGQSWDTLKIKPGYYFKNIKMLNPMFGSVYSSYGFYLTDDGGKSWKKLISKNEIDSVDKTILFTSFALMTKNKMIAGAKDNDNNYFHYLTNDAGKTWTKISSPVYVGDYSFTDTSNGWFNSGWQTYDSITKNTTNYIMIYHTSDGGYTWSKQLDTNTIYNEGLAQISFYDKLNGVTVGSWESIYRTTNGGKSWLKQLEPYYSGKQYLFFNYCKFIKPNTVYLLSVYGDFCIYTDNPTSVEVNILTLPSKIYTTID